MMQTKIQVTLALIAGAVLLIATSMSEAAVYGVAAGPNRAVVSGPRGVVAAGPNGAVAVRRPVATLPAGYIRTVPAGYRTVVYRGYNCRFVGGVYYRPVMYGGTTVYVVVN